MKRLFLTIFLIITLSILSNSTSSLSNQFSQFKSYKFKPVDSEIKKEKPKLICKTKFEWKCLLKAIIWQESKNNDSIVGIKDDTGILQITPIYLEEVNRILLLTSDSIKTQYKLEDRFNREKSIEMFNIIQNYHNRKKDIYTAIELHNPLAPKSYTDNILKYYYQNLEEESSNNL